MISVQRIRRNFVTVRKIQNSSKGKKTMIRN
uniref:Uncharacterized protein n=1 Tax=Rhizophora mucronata TaxID=61149 RepID=A0A2P2QJF7_RHIMU